MLSHNLPHPCRYTHQPLDGKVAALDKIPLIFQMILFLVRWHKLVMTPSSADPSEHISSDRLPFFLQIDLGLALQNICLFFLFNSSVFWLNTN